VLEALKTSRVTDIYMLGRRGPAQAAFTNPELKELDELQDADVIVRPEDIELDPLSNEYVLSSEDRNAERNVQTMLRYSQEIDPTKPRRIHMRFLVSPTRIIGQNAVEAIEVVHNELYRADDGSLRPRATDRKEVLPVELVFRSIGYKGVPLPGVPFDHRAGVIPNAQGRVIDPDTSQPLTGEYAVGWIKRGPSGIIGTNKPDAQESVNQLLADLAAGKVLNPSAPSREAIDALLAERNVEYDTFADWLKLDEIEQQRGAALGRPRLKFTRVEDMLQTLREIKGATKPAAD
jgi:ferredoxin--NADP+ reductase